MVSPFGFGICRDSPSIAGHDIGDRSHRLANEVLGIGQLYVALSRVRSPADLCLLLPDDLTDLTIDSRIDPEVVHMVRSLDNDNPDGPMDDFHSEADGGMNESDDDMPSPLEGPNLPEGDDQVSDGHEEHREEEEFELFDPFPMPTASTPELARDLEWQTNLPREDMFQQ
jgi:hypothetical protein